MSFDINKFKEKLITIDSIALLYILIVGGLCYILNISSMTKAILALPSLLIIPYLIGKISSLFLKKYMDIKFNYDIVSNFIIFWCIGSIALILIAYILNYFWLFDAKIYVVMVIILMIIGIIYGNNHKGLEYFINSYRNNKSILFSSLAGIIAMLFITQFSPYPYAQSADSINHDSFTMDIIKKNFFADSPGYLFSLHLIVSIIIQVFNIYNDSYTLWWASRFIVYPLYAIGLYLFSYQLSKNSALSLFASVFGIFSVSHMPGPLYFTDFAPKTIIMIMFPYFLFFIHKNILQKTIYNNITIRQLINMFLFIFGIFVLFVFIFDILLPDICSRTIGGDLSFLGGVLLPLCIISPLLFLKYKFKNTTQKNISFLLFLIMASLLIFYGIFGFFAFFFLMCIPLFFFLKAYNIKVFNNVGVYNITKILIYLSILFAFLFFFLQLLGILNFSSIYSMANVGESSTSDGFENRMINLNTFYPLITLFFFVLGCIFAFFHNKDKYLALLFITSVAFAIFFAPIALMFRMSIFFHVFVAYFAAYGLIKLYWLFFTETKIKFVSLLFAFAIIVLLTSIIGHSVDEINKGSREGIFSPHIPIYFFSTGDWIKNHLSEDTFMIGGGDWESKTIFAYTGREYNEIYGFFVIKFNNNLTPETIDVHRMFLTQNADDAYKMINNISKSEKHICRQYYHDPMRCKQQLQSIEISNVVVMMNRNSKWVLKKYNPGYSDDVVMNKFYNKRYFTLLYNDTNNQVYIFGVNPEPGVPFKIQNNSK